MDGDLEGYVQSVNGPIEADQLGITLTHEHTFIDMRNWFHEPESAAERHLAEEPVSLENLWYIRRNPTNSRDNYLLGSMSTAIEELKRFHRAGGNTVVDVTPKGVGQDPRSVKQVSRETGLEFVHGTSYYVRGSHPERIDRVGIDELTDEFVSDVRHGIDNTDVPAGIIGEVGLSADTNGDIHEQELKVLRAGARAARITGAPLTIHPPGRTERAQRDRSYPTSRWCLEVLDIVEEEGLPADRVIMSHMDRTLFEDLSYQKELAERGPYLEYDLWGTEFYLDEWNDGFPSDKWRIDAVSELIDAGYLSNLLFSHDVCQKIQLTKYGGFGYDHLLTNAIPMLSYHGISDKQIRQITVTNPKSILTFEEPA